MKTSKIIISRQEQVKMNKSASRNIAIELGIKPFSTKIARNKKVYDRKDFKLSF